MKQRTYNRLSEERVKFLKDSYLFLSDEKLAEVLGYNSATSVRKIRQLLGLKRTKEAVAKAVREIPMIVWMPRDWADCDKFQIKEGD
jgi:biotin operon repressor